MLPASLNNYQRFLLITCIISLISWAGLARIIRGQIMSLKNNEYILAAKSLGLSHLQIIIKHLLPQISSFLIIAIAISIPGYIIGESSLSFLGLGINEPDPSWGNMLAQGKDLANIINHPWILWSPTICLFLCIYSFNTIANYFREKLA
jgi:peptide/nickel transport system permease protein